MKHAKMRNGHTLSEDINFNVIEKKQNNMKFMTKIFARPKAQYGQSDGDTTLRSSQISNYTEK
jgi:hypothetical protein